MPTSIPVQRSSQMIANRLLCIVTRRGPGCGAGRHQLQPTEPFVHLGRVRRKIHATATIMIEPSVKPSNGDTKMKATVLRMPAEISAPAPAFTDHRAHDATGMSARGAAGNAVVPGDHVPGDRAHQGTKHHVRIHNAGCTMPFAHRRRHAEVGKMKIATK